MKIPIRFPKFVIAILLGLLLFLFVKDHFPVQINCNIENTPTRSVVKTSVQVEALWGASGINLENIEQSLPMVSTPELLITARRSCNEVTAFELKTGEIVWTTEQDDPDKKLYHAINSPENLTLDGLRNRIYVSGFDEIRAIDISDGSTIWRNTSDHFVRNAHRVVIHEDGQLTVKALGEWYIDPNSGELSETPIPSESQTSSYTPTIDEQVRQIVSKITGYSIISNAARKDNVIYILDSGAELHLLDAKSGEEIGFIQFERPAKADLLYSPGGIGGSWVTVEDNTLAIFFQDSDVLSVYELQ